MIEPFSISAMIFEPGIFLAILMFISRFQAADYINRLTKLALQPRDKSAFVFHPCRKRIIHGGFYIAYPHILAFYVIPCDDREDVRDGFLSLGHVKTVNETDARVN